MIEKIKEIDPNFTESAFKTFVDNVFVQIHLSIMTKEIENIDHFVSDNLYEKLKSHVEELKEQNLIEMYDELNVKQTTILNVEITEEEIIIKVNITSRYMKYYLNEDGDYVSGNNKSRIEKENYLTFIKKVETRSMEKIRKCKTCGSQMDINASGKCSFCGSIYKLEKEGWILESLEVN